MRLLRLLITRTLWASVAVFAGPEAVQGERTWWQCPPPARGNWFCEHNWTLGVPEAGDLAYIDDGGIAEIAPSFGPPDPAEARRLYVGYEGAGCILHSAGVNAVGTELYLGYDTGSSGRYELSATAALSAGREYVGYGARGAFAQTGGTHTVRGSLYLAYDPGTSGNYELSGASALAADWEYVGYHGTGTFTQTDGTNTFSSAVNLGYYADAVGTYHLSGQGRLLGGGLYVGRWGTGSFTQTGGTNALTGSLHVGCCRGGSGLYELSGAGILSAMDEWVADLGTGTFVQTGGTNTIRRLLLVGASPGSSGSYLQRGGATTIGEEGLVVGWVADSVGTYELSGTATLTAEAAYVGRESVGTFRQTGGTNTISGSLYVGYGYTAPDTAVGTYELSGAGMLSANREYVGYQGKGTFTQTGGTNTVHGRLDLGYYSTGSGTYELSGPAVLSTDSVYVGGNGAGRLDISGPGPSISVRALLRFGTDSVLLAGPGAVVHMTGADLENVNTDPADLAGLRNLTLVFEGGPSEVETMEVAGQDLGADLAGYAQNFELGRLRVGAADVGMLTLAEGFNNQPGQEALYVMNLNVGPGSVLDLRGLNLYYLTGVIAPGATVLGGAPVRIDALGGDATLSGAVDYADLSILATYYDCTDMSWGQGDFTGEGRVDYVDLGVLATNYGLGSAGGAGRAIPEPAAILLLAAGALAVRRRKKGEEEREERRIHIVSATGRRQNTSAGVR